MKKFLKNNGHWIRAVVIFCAVIFAAGKITNSHAELCRAVEKKIDKEVYQANFQAILRELDQLQQNQKRIEAKLDNAVANPKSYPGRIRD